MACSRGAAAPTAHTQKRLFAASAGFCQNPSCASLLFSDEAGKSIHIAEMAHVYAASNDGPRANSAMTKNARGSFENLIVLCSNCHTKVDKAPDAYPDSMMLGWKREHSQKLEAVFGAVRLENRSDVHAIVEPLLAENHAIFNQYGPHIEAALNPESGAAEQWTRKMLTRIIPNSYRMLAILDINRHLVTPSEKIALERFRQHVDDLQAFHIEGIHQDGTRFPADFAKIMEN
ncbi:hypothetical protein [Pseudomonas frederiksbergensis]|uniref:hypothetical protein n=1 Tax=Pseudomonas frederiksbergensis TaxID=104087 RepID=UPI003D1EB2C7